MKRIFLTLVIVVGFIFTTNVDAAKKAGNDQFKALDNKQLNKSLDELAPFELRYDGSQLTDAEKRFLEKMVPVAELVDRLYLSQLYENSWQLFQKIRAQYQAKNTPANRHLLEYFWINKGPYDYFNPISDTPDGLTRFEPIFADLPDMSPTREFYPNDLTRQEFDQWLTGLKPKEKQYALSDYTVIRRDKKKRLKVVSYAKAFIGSDKKNLVAELAAALRDAAGELPKKSSLRSFLEKRAKGLLSNDYLAKNGTYEKSEAMWIDMNGSNDKHAGHIDVTVGPYENYSDEFRKLKAGFKLYVGVLQPKKTAALQRYKQVVQKMDDYLWELYKDHHKGSKEVKAWKAPGAKVTLVAVDSAYTAGMANHGYQTLAYNLPNIDGWKEKYGTKKVMRMNVFDGKYRNILRPIAELIVHPRDLGFVTQDHFSEKTIRHEVAHGIGPGTLVMPNGEEMTVRQRMGTAYSPFEETKAEVVGMLLGYFLVDQGMADDISMKRAAATSLASAFRTVRFGTSSDHAKGKLFEFNRIMQHGGYGYKDGKFYVNHDKFRSAVEKLAIELIDIQMRFDEKQARKLLDDAGQPSKELERGLKKIAAANIPVDLRVRYTFGHNYGVIE